jgi:crotonobetainyl-CoA:carnitine CoA-transferase CaiB-like acyl-CoA transferase
MTTGSNGHDAAGPLSGIRVLEFGSLLAGPLCARLLGDFGADVIKVESPSSSDPLRQWGLEPFHGRDLLWTIYARNKRCITIDLRQPEGQELVRELAKRCDIVVENFRPGTLEKWGLGPADLEAVNPDLIMVRVSGFGQTGPYSEKAGFGSVAEAMGGIRYVTGYPDRAPTRTGVSLGDSLAALFGVIGALLALCSRERNGRGRNAPTGQVVDVAIYEAVYALMESLVPEYVLQGKIRERTGAILPHVAPSNVYPCSDGVSVIIAGNADNVFRRLCDAMGQPELSSDPRFATHQARGEHQEEIDALVAAWTVQHPSQEVIRLMDEAGVPAGPIYTAREIIADPHFQARNMVLSVPIEEGVEFPMTGIVPLLNKTPGSVRWPGSAAAGSHNREVYSEVLGLSDARIDDLAARGVI